jgi:hypothetical protein
LDFTPCSLCHYFVFREKPESLNYWLRNRGSILGRGQEIFLFSISSRPALGPTEPPMGTWGGFPGREVHSPLCNTAVKNGWSYTSTSLYIFIVRCLINLGNSAFIFTYLFSDYQRIRLYSVE